MEYCLGCSQNEDETELLECIFMGAEVLLCEDCKFAMDAEEKPSPSGGRLVFWQSRNPETCQLCEVDIENIFIDGRTQRGPWAIMCESCHASWGVGLGTGKGQKYVYCPDTNRYQKIAG